MKLDQFLHQRQSDAGSFYRAALGACDSPKSFEDVRQLRFRNTGAGILDSQLGLPFPCIESNGYTTGEGKLQCVRKKVQNNFLPHLAVNVDGLRKRLTIDLKSQEPGPLHRRAEIRRKIFGDIPQVGRLVIRLNSSCLKS